MKSELAPKVAGTVVISAALLMGAYFVLAGNQPDPVSSQVAVTTVTQDELPIDETNEEEQAIPADINEEAATESSNVNIEAAEPEVTEVDIPTSTYLDGSYSVSASYSVPRGQVEGITVSVVIANDIVTSLVVDNVAPNNKSAEYQADFDSLINDTVEGQDLDDADVSRLSGASLTSDAYNDLLDAIRNEARA